MGGPFPTEKSSPPHPPRIHPPRARFNHWASERASVHPLFLFLFFFLCHVGWVGSLVGGGWAESGRPRWAAATPTRALSRLPRSSPPSRAPSAGRPAHSAPPLSTTSTATQPPHPHLVSERGPPRSPSPPPPSCGLHVIPARSVRTHWDGHPPPPVCGRLLSSALVVVRGSRVALLGLPFASVSTSTARPPLPPPPSTLSRTPFFFTSQPCPPPPRRRLGPRRVPLFFFVRATPTAGCARLGGRGRGRGGARAWGVAGRTLRP